MYVGDPPVQNQLDNFKTGWVAISGLNILNKKFNCSCSNTCTTM